MIMLLLLYYDDGDFDRQTKGTLNGHTPTSAVMLRVIPTCASDEFMYSRSLWNLKTWPPPAARRYIG